MTNEDLNQIAGTLIANAIGAGLDLAAEELLILLDGAVNEDQAYRDGIEDALLTLIKHGATDPR